MFINFSYHRTGSKITFPSELIITWTEQVLHVVSVHAAFRFTIVQFGHRATSELQNFMDQLPLLDAQIRICFGLYLIQFVVYENKQKKPFKLVHLKMDTEFIRRQIPGSVKNKRHVRRQRYVDTCSEKKIGVILLCEKVSTSH